MKKVLLSLLLSLSITIPAYSAGCKLGDVVDCTTEAKKGDALAQTTLGVMYDEGARYRLGICYYNGDGVEYDPEKAVELWREDAEKGSSHAQYRLGVAYHNGDGAEQDLKEAEKWFKKSCWTRASSGTA